jgi:alcohol dehydrogenase class IV
LPHAEAHTVILPHAIAYNEPYASEAIGKLKPVLGVENVAQGLWQLQNEVGAPMTLQQLGMQEADLERAADLACQKPYPNPAPLERARLLQLLNNAFHGNEPGSV